MNDQSTALPADSPCVPGADAPANHDSELYRFLIESLTEYAVFAVSPSGTIASWNSGAQQTFGYTQAEIIGQPFDVIFSAEDAAQGAPQAELADALRTGFSHYDRWHVRKDGSRFWGSNTVQPLFGADGALLAFTKLVRDTTASYLASERLSDSEQQLRLLVESVRDYAIFSIDLDGRIITWSAGARRVFGYTPDDVIGRNVSILFSAADIEAGHAADELRSAALGESINIERRLVRKDGSTFLAGGKTSMLRAGSDGELRGFVKVVHDATEEHTAAEHLRRRAQHDTLTELPNRGTFHEHVARAIAIHKRRSSSRYAVLFVDLDHFKAINDEFGHFVADHVLFSIARRLETCVRSGDVVARIGGDEFAILLNGIAGSLDADDAAQRILSLTREAVSTDAGDIYAAASVGIAIGNASYNEPAEILKDADAAMYTAKSQGRSRAVLFDETIGSVVRSSTDLTAALRLAVERNELRVAYQPVLRLRDMKVVGFEALVRWKHPARGLLHPDAFIPQAEESNLVLAVDRWVFSQACKQLSWWQSRGIVQMDVQMSVNVSSKEFSHDEFVTDLESIVESSSVDPACLRLEITETTPLERSARSYGLLAAVRAIGVQIDVDDFGTGYASLGALNCIVVDGLKVDWSFVNSMGVLHGWEIAESVISLAHKLGLIAVAEGIENAEQLRRLTTLGCDLGQGRLFAPALGAVAATAFMRERAARSRHATRSAPRAAPTPPAKPAD